MILDFAAATCCKFLLGAAPAEQKMRVHAGKVLRASMGPLCASLRVGRNGELEPVHSAVHADAEVAVPFARALGDRGVPLRSGGDGDFLAALADYFSSADIGPDAQVERFFGADAGAAAANCIENARELAADSRARIVESVRSWLIREVRLVPDPVQHVRHAARLADFVARVERLRKRVSMAAEEGAD